jgi:hypothetical protein
MQLFERKEKPQAMAMQLNKKNDAPLLSWLFYKIDV